MMARSFTNKAGEMIISTGGGKTSFAKGNFFAALDHFGDVTVPESYSKLLREVALSMINKLVDKSPVDTGRFRCSWVAGVNRADNSIPIFTSDTGGESSKARVLAALANLKFGDSLYISNNLAYALMLEYGWSGQAPNGVAEISVMEVEAEFGKKGGA
jgi:hypothetical protein